MPESKYNGAFTGAQVDAILTKANGSESYTSEEKTKLAGLSNYDDTALQTAVAGKVDKVTGKGLSTNDYTTTEKNKLSGIAAGAEVNVQSDWSQSNNSADDFIKNKPSLGTAAAKNYTDSYSATGTDVTTGKAVKAALDTLTTGVSGVKGNAENSYRTGNVNLTPANLGLESKAAASGGTAVSLVTTGEKDVWNNKQGAISDLSTIRSGAALGATAVQPETGKGLSTNDYTTAEKNKLGGLSGEDLFVLGDELASNGDLNSLTTPGCWRATTAAIATSITNIPADVTTAFFGATIPSITGSRYIQLLVPNDDTGAWYKRCYTGSWQSWVKYKPDPTAQLAENVDLNTLTTEGIWYGYNAVGSSAQHLPVPNGNFNIRVENVMVGAVYLRQSCYIAQIQNVYTEFVRVKNVSSGGAWQPWMMAIAHGAAGLNLVSNDDLNDYTTPGIYQCSGPTVGATLSNSPTSQPFRMEVSYFATTSSLIQKIIAVDDTTSGQPEVYYRVKFASGWKSWHKFTGTAVT